MSLAAVASLYNLGKSSTFAVRNVDKTANGDYVRGLVAVAQANNGIKAMTEWNNIVGEQAKRYVNAIDKAAKPWDLTTKTCNATVSGTEAAAAGAATAGVATAAGKRTFKGLAAYCLKTASNYVNPLIVISGGVKVATSNDKKTEAINQGCALGAMFTAEKTAYKFLTPEGRALIQNKNFAQKGPIKSVLNTMAKIDRYAAGTKSSRFGKIAIPLLKAATFVCASIGGYAIGSEIADKINEARGVKTHALAKNNNPASNIAKKDNIMKENIIEKDFEQQPLEYIS